MYLTRLFTVFALSVVASAALALPPDSQDELGALRLLNHTNYFMVTNSSIPTGLPYDNYVKFSLIIDKDDLAFQDSNKHLFHSDYLQLREEFKGMSRTEIDALTLHDTNRRAFLGALFIGKDGKTADFEVISNSPVPTPKLIEIYNRLRAAVDKEFIAEIRYSPTPELRAAAEADRDALLKAGIHVVSPLNDEKLIVYNPTWTVGRVRVLSDQQLTESWATIKPTDILVLEKAPRELPPVAGVLIATPTAPSSHIALLAKMLDAPFAYAKDLLKDPKWRDRDGHLVALRTMGRIEVVDSLTTAEVERLTALKFTKSDIDVVVDRKTKDIRPIKDLQRSDIPAYGGKASQTGLLVRLFPGESPADAVGVPVYYYDQFITLAKTKSGENLGDLIARKMKSIEPQDTDQSVILSTLDEVRKAIKTTAIPKSLLEEITAELKRHFPGSKERIKIRSSSPVEDIEEMNSAGLYDSEGAWLSGAPADEQDETVERALNKVWRSLFNDRAYLARRRFGVKDTQVAMADLVQRSFKGELANGVMISEINPNGELTLTVTGFPGEDLEVTHPPEGKLPESMVITIGNAGKVALRKTQACTEIPLGRNLLDDAEYQRLFEMAKITHEQWPVKNPRLKLDFEWKIMPKGADRQVIVKQVRPVPQPKQMGPDSEFVFFGGRDLHWVVKTPEDPDALSELQRPLGLSLKIPPTFKSDLDKGNLIVERAKLYGRTGTYVLENLKVKVETSKPPHLSGATQYTARIQLPNAELPSLQVTMTISNYQWGSGGAYTYSPTLSVNDLQTFIGVSEVRDLVRFRKTPPPDHTSLPLWYMQTIENAKNYWPIERKPFKEIFKGVKLLVQASGVELHTGPMQKTLFKHVRQTRITGLLPRELVINGPRISAYAPAHHNFTWEYGTDLFQAEDLTEAERDELAKLGGRYLVARSPEMDGGQIAKMVSIELWSEDGVMTKIDEAPEAPRSPQAAMPMTYSAGPATMQDCENRLGRTK